MTSPNDWSDQVLDWFEENGDPPVPLQLPLSMCLSLHSVVAQLAAENTLEIWGDLLDHFERLFAALGIPEPGPGWRPPARPALWKPGS